MEFHMQAPQTITSSDRRLHFEDLIAPSIVEVPIAPSPATTTTNTEQDVVREELGHAPDVRIEMDPILVQRDLAELNEKMSKLMETLAKQQAQAPSPSVSQKSFAKRSVGSLCSIVKWIAASAIPYYLVQVHRDAHLHAKTAQNMLNIPYRDRYWKAFAQALHQDGITLEMIPGFSSIKEKLLPTSLSSISQMIPSEFFYNTTITWMKGQVTAGVTSIYDFTMPLFNSTTSLADRFSFTLDAHAADNAMDAITQRINSLSLPQPQELYEYTITPILNLDSSYKIIIVASVVISGGALLTWKISKGTAAKTQPAKEDLP
jgi:hypothetical protein